MNSEPVKQSENRICERCGCGFSCGANAAECWCFKVNVPATVLEDLKMSYNSCLCPQCLAATAGKGSEYNVAAPETQTRF